MRINLLDFQYLFGSDHNCVVLKLYSKKNSPGSIWLDDEFITDITYWDQLDFENASDISLFLLKWI